MAVIIGKRGGAGTVVQWAELGLLRMGREFTTGDTDSKSFHDIHYGETLERHVVRGEDI